MLAKQHAIDLNSIVDVDFFASRAGYNKDVVSPRRNKRASVNFSSTPGTPVSPRQSACGRIGASISLGSILLQRRDDGAKEAQPKSAPVSMRASQSYDSGRSAGGSHNACPLRTCDEVRQRSSGVSLRSDGHGSFDDGQAATDADSDPALPDEPGLCCAKPVSTL